MVSKHGQNRLLLLFAKAVKALASIISRGLQVRASKAGGGPGGEA